MRAFIGAPLRCPSHLRFWGVVLAPVSPLSSSGGDSGTIAHGLVRLALGAVLQRCPDVGTKAALKVT